MRRLRAQSGFTLLEMLIASAIFVTATVAVTDIFVQVNQVQNRTRGIQQTASDARYALEEIARSARLYPIDYSYAGYGASIDGAGETVLALRTLDNTPLRYGLQSSAAICADSDATGCLAVCFTESCLLDTDWLSITPQGIEVTQLLFLITPTSDPFTRVGGAYPFDIQPRVTIIFDSNSLIASTHAEEIEYLHVQTTISSRQYER